MSDIESTLVTRVSEFVAAMNDVAQKTGVANTEVERQVAGFQATATQSLTELTGLAGQFDTHGRSLAEAVALIDRSNRRTEGALSERRLELEALVTTLDSKGNDLEQRLTRFSSLLDQSLEGAAERAREIARLVAESTTSGARAISENFEAIRTGAEEERKRATEAMQTIYEQATGDSQTMLTQAAERFADVVEGLKRMSSDMQRELEATRTELRRGILELPQETAESAAQMRRVIVDQIEALAELNRIVARHGRSLDVAEPSARRVEAVEAAAPRRVVPSEAVLTNGGQRPEPPRPQRADITGLNPPAMPTRRADAPSLSPVAQGSPPAQGGPAGGRTGWLSDLLTRASQEPEPAPPGPAREPPREVAREAPREVPREPPPDAQRGERHSIESLDSLAVDIARMIDHEAAADLWDRYKRGERNVFTRKLYTMQGQKAFEEIRRKYRADREFMRTVDRYIVEFERLLEEVSRDDRGQVVARTYLTSETGKVYTMLAHAAGRFD
jgi:hypothetical protein